MNTDIKPICIGCSELAENIPEYKAASELMGIPVNDYVQIHEGTYNATTGGLLCWNCWCLRGMPEGEAL